MSRATIFTAVSVVFLLVSMVFLVLGMVALPVSSSLKLASTSSYTYGIFGYCSDGTCPSALYPVSFGDIDTDENWLLASATRNTLSKTFIVAPIAAGLTFFSIIFTVIGLFVVSSPVKIFSIVFGVISFVATTLVAVMVVLVFYPNVAWTGWLYIAAAALALLAVPALLLSIDVLGGDDDSDEESEKNFGTYGNANETSFSGGPLLQNQQPKSQFYGPQVITKSTDEMSSISKDYSYRGAARENGYSVRDDSHSSLLQSNPRVANDITKPNTIPTSSSRNNSNASFYDAVSLNQGPSTPISAKQKMAPNYIPNVAIPSNNSGYKPVSNLPYPKNDRASTNYNPNALGVFDHHPNVEGHQPFTELEDNDIHETNSILPTRQIDSDEESDFTSVSQRAPNVMYQGGPPPQQQQYQQRAPQLYPTAVPQCFSVPAIIPTRSRPGPVFILWWRQQPVVQSSVSALWLPAASVSRCATATAAWVFSAAADSSALSKQGPHGFRQYLEQ